MPTNTDVKSQSMGIVNHAVGSVVTTSAAAAALTLTVGFVPRVIRFHNVTDRISEEWYEGIDEGALYANIRGLNAKLDADATVGGTDYASLWNPASASLADLKAAIVGIVAKLDADSGVTDTNFAALWTPASATFALIKASLNGINAKLDADAGVTDTDYAALWNDTANSIHTVAAGTRTFEKANGVLNNLDGTFTLNATAMVASKVFTWEAIG